MPVSRSARLVLRDVRKSFGGVRALDGRRALGGARARSSACAARTAPASRRCCKVLSGVYPFGSYRGEVRVRGARRRPAGTADAQRAGIAMVHQELMLVPELSVAENLLLGREPARLGMVDDAALEAARARAMLQRFGVGDGDRRTAKVGALGIGLQQVVEIVRALSTTGRVLVLDEPTAAPDGREAARLITWLRDLRAGGTTCVYVSHRIDKVFALCDRVTVLRDGRAAGTRVTAETTPDEVIALMVGRASQRRARRAARLLRGEPPPELEAAAAPVLELPEPQGGPARGAPEERTGRQEANASLSRRVARRPRGRDGRARRRHGIGPHGAPLDAVRVRARAGGAARSGSRASPSRSAPRGRRSRAAWRSSPRIARAAASCST